MSQATATSAQTAAAPRTGDRSNDRTGAGPAGDRVIDAPAAHRRDWRRILRPILMLGGIAAVIVGSAYF